MTALSTVKELLLNDMLKGIVFSVDEAPEYQHPDEADVVEITDDSPDFDFGDLS